MSKDKFKGKKDLIEAFKTSCEKLAREHVFFNGVSFYQDDKNGVFHAVTDAGKYKVELLFYNMYFLTENVVDVAIKYPNNDYYFSLYDIFNLFDIQDFNFYFFKECSTPCEIDGALKKIFKKLNDMNYEICNAGDSTYLPQLVSNFEKDRSKMEGGDKWKEDYEPLVDDAVHPIFSYADEDTHEKVYKKLSKHQQKGKPITLYEERLLTYMNGGKTLYREAVEEKKQFEKLFKKTAKKSLVAVFSICAIVAVILWFVIHWLIFKETQTFAPIYDLGFAKIEINSFGIAVALASAFLVALGLYGIAGKNAVIKMAPEKLEQQMGEKYEAESKKEYGAVSKPLRLIASVVAILIGLGAFSLSLNDVGFGADGLLWFNFGIVEVEYTDVEIYKVEGYYDEETKEFIECDNYYTFVWDDTYYEYGEVDPNGDAQAKINEIIEKYNKDVKNIKTIEELDVY